MYGINKIPRRSKYPKLKQLQLRRQLHNLLISRFKERETNIKMLFIKQPYIKLINALTNKIPSPINLSPGCLIQQHNAFINKFILTDNKLISKIIKIKFIKKSNKITISYININ